MAGHHVYIRIRTLQRRDGERDSLVQQVEGRLTQEDGGWLLTYAQEEQGLTTLTSLSLSGEKAVLRRSGAVGSQMVFQEGQAHSSLYETPYGSLPMSLHTQQLRWSMDETGGKLSLIYRLDLGGAHMGETRLELTVTKKAPTPDAKAKETFV